MAQYRVETIEAQSSGDLHADTFVETDEGTVIGHFTVVFKAADVLALAGLDKAERIAGYKALFYADPRIRATKDSEAAYAQMVADVPFPITVPF